MATLKDQADIFPHVRTRMVNGQGEPYLPGTGLAVWEVVWLSHVYRENIAAMKQHLGLANPITPDMIVEALEYAREHADDIDPVVREIEEMTLERLRERFPRIRASPRNRESRDQQHS